MHFSLNKTIEIIERTPAVLYTMLEGLSGEWVYSNEGENTWTVFDVIGHLIVCEKTDFIVRAKVMLSATHPKLLSPIDMHAQFVWNKGKTINDLLKEFSIVRKENIAALLALQLTESDLQKTAIHPRIGALTLQELLATWATHDLNHLSQIARVMAKQYKEAVGPFIEFVSIIK